MYLVSYSGIHGEIIVYCASLNFLHLSRYDKGAYLFLPSYVMRIHGAKQQRDAVKRTPKNQLDPVFEVWEHWLFYIVLLDYLSMMIASHVK